MSKPGGGSGGGSWSDADFSSMLQQGAVQPLQLDSTATASDASLSMGT